MSNNLVNSNVINCLKAGDIVDGVIKEKMKHGWRVKIASVLDAIMPFSEFDANVFRKPEDFINRVMKFRILEFSQSPYQLIVSRLNSLIKNMVIEGTVSHICRIDEGQWRWMPQQIRNFMDVLCNRKKSCLSRIFSQLYVVCDCKSYFHNQTAVFFI